MPIVFAFPYRWHLDPITDAGQVHHAGTTVHVDSVDDDGADRYAELAAVEVGDGIRLVHETGVLQVGPIVEIDVLPAPSIGESDTLTYRGDVIASPTFAPQEGDPVDVERFTYITPNPTSGETPMSFWKMPKGEFGLSLTDPGQPIADATIADYTDFSCQVLSGVITPQGTGYETDTVRASWCGPASSSIRPVEQTYTVDMELFQDPHEVAGLQQFLWDNRAGLTSTSVWFYMGLNDGAAPKAIGKVFLLPEAFGGEAFTVLEASLSLPCDGTPDLEWGTSADV